VSPLDRAVLAERAMAVERHLRRVADRLPDSATALEPATDASDAVILHLWQATQVVIDLAMTACLALDLGTPSSYGDAFRRLGQADVIDRGLADRLVKAAGLATSSRTPTTQSTCSAYTGPLSTGPPISAPS